MLRRHLLAVPASLAAVPAWAEGDVDLLLVVAIDASGSIDEAEFRLQRDGCAEAIQHASVLAAIRGGPMGAIGIAMVEWGAPGGAATVVDWQRVDGPASAARVAEAFRAAPRSRQSWNAIGDAIDHAARLIAGAPFRAARKVIDVSGDAPDMRGLRSAPVARDDAVEAGISINALAILGGVPGLADVFGRGVIGGPGAFVMTAEGRPDFARAMRAKLVREIA
ncbi:DUF1194 domain-containing protein [Roseomonas marmotae]|uniref:DUF1194 domain-containing protein n=1 Tax=Roseomonas marmotae TaxID=2768161 RepID=A0ABS3K8X8_9PROT|nr:DUF1194 domain-containing protein [Roseomonas marmotae]MBO1073921.1 DUF1194 domain-containing protein [Roseomonas marmotae]QTI78463.1 DUF1194 domain-containing protein [Roseomonas marmotae]